MNFIFLHSSFGVARLDFVTTKCHQVSREREMELSAALAAWLFQNKLENMKFAFGSFHLSLSPCSLPPFLWPRIPPSLLFACLSAGLSVWLFISLSLSVHLAVLLSGFLSVCLSFCLFLSLYLSICEGLSVCPCIIFNGMDCDSLSLLSLSLGFPYDFMRG